MARGKFVDFVEGRKDMNALVRRVFALVSCGAALIRNRMPAALAVMLFSTAASATSVSGAIITGIAIDTQSGNFAFIQISVAKGTTNPACSTSSFAFVLPLTTTLENQFLAVLLAARAAQAPVQSLLGSGQCDVQANVETLVGVTY
jgi:hypothetical protein